MGDHMCGDIYFTITCAATRETREDEKSWRPNLTGSQGKGLTICEKHNMKLLHIYLYYSQERQQCQILARKKLWGR